MEDGLGRVDFYSVLKVNPDCDARILELAYHYFAKMYHPDNAETADPDRFNDVMEAYRTLRDPEKRAEYDRTYGFKTSRPAFQIPPQSDFAINEDTAAGDAEAHAKILLYLYKRRREHSDDPGVIGWFVQEMLGCSEDEFQFHLWYLKNKRFIEVTEQGTIAVTIDGVDHVIAMSRGGPPGTLRIRQTAGF
ncbi:J domain-containing protein [Croceicoccus naphthovorans]|uniref:Uncharacterized protein n=1 Tax=Croceicoccus naphthovorans TaxID=1348774 RepID=A0A0G3XII8_9SPHN|nr:DnaJ domain-containing protein [Croceicoccus naphthovorans]AKM11012.1 hypothetical protein AB433_15205 [Croceicoccus naphthovorans]MBB3989568.1 curved DNA-binding protein [Croceicoccus naphthovorans]